MPPITSLCASAGWAHSDGADSGKARQVQVPPHPRLHRAPERRCIPASHAGTSSEGSGAGWGPTATRFLADALGGTRHLPPPVPPPDRRLAPAARLALPGTSPAPLPCGAAIDSTRLPLPFSTAPETLCVRLAGKEVRSGLALVDWNGPVDVGLYLLLRCVQDCWRESTFLPDDQCMDWYKSCEDQVYRCTKSLYISVAHVYR